MRRLGGRGAGLVLTRYGVALLVIGEALLFARLLGSAQYGPYTLVVQTAGLLLFAVTGSASGYVYSHFREPGESLDIDYVAIAVVHHIAVAIIAAAVLYLMSPLLTASALLFAIYIPYYVTEPLLRVRHRYTIAVLAKGFGSIGTLSLVLLTRSRHLSLESAVVFLLAGNFMGYVLYYGCILQRRYVSVTLRDIAQALLRTNSWHRYWKDILQPGIPINISGALYLFFTYTDRYFIAHFRSAQTLSNYSLAWQLGQGALLLLTSMNVISSIRIGEQHKEETVRATLRHHLLLTGMAAVAALAGLVVLTYILAGTFYRGYQDLIPMTAIISAGYLGHGIAGSVTSFLTYHRRFGAVNLSYAGVVLTCIATNYAVITLGWRPMAALTLTTLGLLVMSTGLCLYTFLVASRMTRPVPVGQAT